MALRDQPGELIHPQGHPAAVTPNKMDTFQTNLSAAPATLEPTTPPAQPATYALQSRDKAQRLTAALETLRAVMNDPAALERLEAHGYDTDALAEGMALYTAAQNAYNVRQQAIGRHKDLTAQWFDACEYTREDYRAFRDLARNLFPTAAAQTALGVRGRIPRDFEQFIAHTQASYAAALNTPIYLAGLNARGFSTAELQAQADAVAALVDTYAALRAADIAATQATARRNAALGALEAWLVEFRAVLRFAARERAPVPYNTTPA